MAAEREVDEATQTGDDRPRVGRHQGTRHPDAALVAVDLLRHHRLGRDLRHPFPRLAAGQRARRPGLLGYSSRAQRRRRGRRRAREANAPLDARILEAELAADRRRSRAAALRGRRAAARSSATTAASATAPARQGALGGLPEPARRRLALGRHGGRHPPDHPARHPLRGRPRHPLQPDAGLRRDPGRRRRSTAWSSTCCRSRARSMTPTLAAAQAEQLSSTTARPATARTATGIVEMGAPNLTDAIWLYGGDPDTLRQTITYARYGIMPAWLARMAPRRRWADAGRNQRRGHLCPPARRRPVDGPRVTGGPPWPPVSPVSRALARGTLFRRARPVQETPAPHRCNRLCASAQAFLTRQSLMPRQGLRPSLGA